MDLYDPRRNQEKRRSSARERRAARRRREEGMASRIDGSRRNPKVPDTFTEHMQNVLQRLMLFMHELWWHLRRNPMVVRGAVVMVVLVCAIYLMTTLLSGNIMPRVSVMGVDVGGLSVSEAEDKLRQAWADDIAVALIVQGERFAEVQPETLGIRIDINATARAAKDTGLGAFPFGKAVSPVLLLDRLAAQTYLLDTAEVVDMPPYNAGYVYVNGQVGGEPGRDGRQLDIPLTLERLDFDLVDVINGRTLELVMTPLLPSVRDPYTYLLDVENLVNDEDGLSLRGYDPYANQFFTWPLPPAEFVSWLSTSRNGLTIREDRFTPFVERINETLNEPGNRLRYIEPQESLGLMREGLAQRQVDINLRVRYYETIYTIEPGDRVYGVSRKMGIPFYMVQQANPGMDLDNISPGDQLRIPSRDVTMEIQPVTNKRIIVDLDQQYMVAYENNQVVFEWSISSGLSSAPTSPGIYQILSHAEVAYGSSNTLCDDVTLVCGQWEMRWFMGIYEVVPDLVNGFHGSVLLPNGNLLAGGSVGSPATFGCVMSPDEQAEALYNWAEIGTVVEIISSEYAPYSDLAKATHARLHGNL